MIHKTRLPLWAWIVILIALVAICDVLNFSDMMMSRGSLSSFIISLAYVLIWVTLAFINRKNKSFLTFLSIFWAVCTAAAVLGYCIYADVVSNAILTTMGFFGLLFITPLVGILFVTDSLYLTYIVLVVLSVVFTSFGIVLMKPQGRQCQHKSNYGVKNETHTDCR